MIKIAIAGCYGKMGKLLVKEVVDSPELTLTAATVSASHPALDTDVGIIAGLHPLGFKPSDNLSSVINHFDCLIDFSSPSATMSHLKLCKAQGKKMVIGTTGFTEEQQGNIKTASLDIPILWAPNMSIGINIVYSLIEQVATLLKDNAEIEIIEAHHSHKKDSPSGTAMKIGELIAHALDRNLQQVAVYDRRGIGIRDPNSIGFSTIRAKDIVGEHTALFALDGERIEITHKAANRIPFAKGAVRAAIWLAQKGPGLYSMRDIINCHTSEDWYPVRLLNKS